MEINMGNKSKIKAVYDFLHQTDPTAHVYSISSSDRKYEWFKIGMISFINILNMYYFETI